MPLDIGYTRTQSTTEVNTPAPAGTPVRTPVAVTGTTYAVTGTEGGRWSPELAITSADVVSTFTGEPARQFNHGIVTSPNAPLGRLLSADFSLLALDDLPFTGTPDATMFARGDGTWAVPAGGALADAGLCQGRLTLTSGVPVTAADVTAAGTLYFTPHGGNRIALYDAAAAAWASRPFAELSSPLTGATADTNYDVFVFLSGGVPLLGLQPWTDGTTRAAALATQDGVYVKASNHAHRYVGTIRTSAANVTEDGLAKRYVWNAYNRVERPMLVVEPTVSWTYGTSAWRQARGNAANRIEYVQGLAGEPVSAEVRVRVVVMNDSGSVGVGVDSAAVNSADLYADVTTSDTAYASGLVAAASYRGHPGVGYHALNWLEYRRTGTITFYGTNANYTLSGIRGVIRG